MRKFGVEIEVYLESIDQLKQELQKNDIPFIYEEKGKKIYFDKVKLTKDITLIKNEKELGLESIEINLPPSTDFILLKKICDILHKINAKVIRNCALHIHLDYSDKTLEDVKKIFYWYRENEENIKKLVKKIQPNNDFSLNKNVSSIKNVFDDIKLHVSKRHNLNIKSYYNIKTIEHRIFSGTIVFEEIKRCVELTQIILSI